jgi:hypothetical protein
VAFGFWWRLHSPPGRNAGGIVALLLTSMHMTLLGALLALTPRPLYSHAGGFTGLSPLDDEHLGGAIMLLTGGLSYLLGGLVLAAGLLRVGQRGVEATGMKHLLKIGALLAAAGAWSLFTGGRSSPPPEPTPGASTKKRLLLELTVLLAVLAAGDFLSRCRAWFRSRLVRGTGRLPKRSCSFQNNDPCQPMHGS